MHAVPRGHRLALPHHPSHRAPRGRQEDLDLLLNLADNIQGRTICALGDAAAMPVRAFVKVFRDEFQHHIDHKCCSVKPGGYSTEHPHTPGLQRGRPPARGGLTMPINLEIDASPSPVDNGATVMDAATKLGIFVPHFCYHKKLSIAANCRMCLVQVEKAPKPLPACATPATEGMKVQTHSSSPSTRRRA
jgi:ferredoxin